MEKVFFKKIFVHHQPHLSYLYIDIIVGTFSHVSTHVYLHVTIHMAEP